MEMLQTELYEICLDPFSALPGRPSSASLGRWKAWILRLGPLDEGLEIEPRAERIEVGVFPQQARVPVPLIDRDGQLDHRAIGERPGQRVPLRFGKVPSLHDAQDEGKKACGVVMLGRQMREFLDPPDGLIDGQAVPLARLDLGQGRVSREVRQRFEARSGSLASTPSMRRTARSLNLRALSAAPRSNACCASTRWL